MSEFSGDVAPRTRPWAENVDPALAALWESGVLTPLETAARALEAAEGAGDRPASLDSAVAHLATARDSLLAAADAVDDDERLRQELVSLAGTLTGVSADLLGFQDAPNTANEAIAARRALLDETRGRLERVLG